MRSLLIPLLLALATPAAAEPWPVCHRGQPKAACVVDGDTLWLAGEKIRLVRIDAPEASHPRCPAEQALAARATAALAEILGAGPVTIERRGVDRYGRTLATVRAGGADAGEEMMRRGLAQEWPGDWCGRE